MVEWSGIWKNVLKSERGTGEVWKYITVIIAGWCGAWKNVSGVMVG